jgi:hypothetical protein
MARGVSERMEVGRDGSEGCHGDMTMVMGDARDG